jgi:hypothetical protein
VIGVLDLRAAVAAHHAPTLFRHSSCVVKSCIRYAPFGSRPARIASDIRRSGIRDKHRYGGFESVETRKRQHHSKHHQGESYA